MNIFKKNRISILYRHISTLLLVVLFLQFAFAQTPDEILNKTINQEVFKDARLGIYVKNLSSDQSIISYNSDKLLAPASILKIATAAAALSTFGPDHRFTTSLYLIGEVNQGVLYGDVVIKGSGDPSFQSRMKSSITIDRLADDVLEELNNKGISCVYGRVVVDASYFSLPAVPSGYMQEDVANYYGAGAFGFNIQENAYEIKLHRSKGGGVSVSGFDSLAVDFITIDVQAKGYSDQAYAYFHPTDGGIHVTGSIPIGTGDFKIKGALKNPPKYAADLLEQILKVKGIEFQDAADAIWMPYVLKNEIIFKNEYHSPPLIDILEPVLHKSNNVFAEVLYRHIIRADDKKAKDFLLDGSGLSPENRISAKQLMVELSSIESSIYFDDFLSVMPKNGLDGTVRSVVKNKPGSIYVKSGSISGVRSYMGFRKTASGDWIGFVCMANDLTAPGAQTRKAWETMLGWVAEL